MTIQYISRIFITVLLAGMAAHTQAQDTSIKRQTIDIRSSFKPVLRNAVKQNFSATPPAVDSSRRTLQYNVPAQNLFLAYEPVPLKPLALQVENRFGWENSSFVKAGFGNLGTPYVSAGFSFGDGKSTALGVYADYIASKGDGKIKFQDYSRMGVALQGSKTTPKNIEFKAKLGYSQDEYFLYGYDQNLFGFTKDQVRQRFNTITINAGLRNTIPTEFGLNYQPELRSTIFNDNRSGSETNVYFNLPLQKNIGKTLGVKLGAAVDFTTYKKPGLSISNNIFYINPALQFKTPDVTVNAGVTPAWDNKELNILPDLTADIRLQGTKFVLQLGWLGYYQKGSYQRWAGINPYIAQPLALKNTKVDERFIGFKGTSGDHIVYGVKAGYYGYKNMPLFVNDTVSGKNFNVVNESSMQAIQLHGEVGFVEKEVFHFYAGLNLNNFSNLKDNARAWGLIPLEVTGSFRWQLFKDFWLRSDAFIWDGATFRAKNGDKNKMTAVIDLNAGLEFRVTKQINLWFQANNLLNNKYQRWRNYEVYGLNLLGGIRFNFNTKPMASRAVVTE
jgi:hypothetical protein